jgi:hypothetical protein
MKLLQNSIALRPFGLSENVNAGEPRRECTAGEEEDRDRPGKVVDAPADRPAIRPIRLIVTKTSVFHLLRCARSPGFHAGRAASNDEPQPQVRAAFGFTM